VSPRLPYTAGLLARRQGPGRVAPARSAASADAVLEVSDLVKYFANRAGGRRSVVRAVDGVSFDLHPGESLGLVGESGCGKSTLARSVVRLFVPTSGRIRFEGRDISALTDDQATRLRRERTGYIFQSFNLIPLLNVRENVELPFTIAGGAKDVKDRVREVIDLVELSGKERHRPDQLSAGEQQRVAVARALVTRPSVLLADEPTGNLDYTNSGELLNALWRSSEDGGQTIVLVTHDARAAAYADRVLVIGDGHIQEEISLGRRADHSAAPLIARLAQVGL